MPASSRSPAPAGRGWRASSWRTPRGSPTRSCSSPARTRAPRPTSSCSRRWPSAGPRSPDHAAPRVWTPAPGSRRALALWSGSPCSLALQLKPDEGRLDLERHPEGLADTVADHARELDQLARARTAAVDQRERVLGGDRRPPQRLTAPEAGSLDQPRGRGPDSPVRLGPRRRPALRLGPRRRPSLRPRPPGRPAVTGSIPCRPTPAGVRQRASPPRQRLKLVALQDGIDKE